MFLLFNKSKIIAEISLLLFCISIKDSSLSQEKSRFEKVASVKGHNGAIYSVVFSSSGEYLGTAGEDGLITILNTHTLERLSSLAGHDGKVTCIQFIKEDKYLVSGGRDGTIRLWDVRNRQLIRIVNDASSGIQCVAFSNQRNILAAGSKSGIVYLWSYPNFVLLKKLYGHTGSVNALEFSPNGDTLATGGNDNLFRLWNIDTYDYIDMAGRPGFINSITYSAGGDTIYSAGNSNDVIVWNVSSQEKFRILTSHESDITSMSISSNGTLLVTGGKDEAIQLWDVVNNSKIWSLDKYGEVILAVTISPDGQFIAAAGENGTITIWKNIQWKGDLFTVKSQINNENEKSSVPPNDNVNTEESSIKLNNRMFIDSLFESMKINTETDKSLLIVHSEVRSLFFDSNRMISKVDKTSGSDYNVWLPPGTHILKISADGFQTLEIPVFSYLKKKSYEMVIKAIDPNLELVTYLLDTEPRGALVRIDDKGVGMTPLKVRLTRGQHKVEIKNDLYESEIFPILLSKSETVEKKELIHQTVDVFVSSSPRGAQVFLNDVPQSITPSTLKVKVNTQYKVEISWEGKKLQTSINVRSSGVISGDFTTGNIQYTEVK
jgi:WD40 repeat protein